jgi:hypothetical protein
MIPKMLCSQAYGLKKSGNPWFRDIEKLVIIVATCENEICVTIKSGKTPRKIETDTGSESSLLWGTY